MLARWKGERLGDQALAMIVDDTAEFLGFARADQYSALIDTLCQDLDCLLDHPTLLRISLQLTCNQQLLIDGQPLQRFHGVSDAQWVPFIICSLAACQFGQRPGIQMSLRVIAGHFAGFTAVKKAPLGFMARLAYDVGFSRRLQYEHPQELEQLMFAGYLVRTSEPELQFTDYAVNAAMRSRNRQLIKSRKDVDE